MRFFQLLFALFRKPVFRLTGLLWLLVFAATAQQSNVVISAAANANGSWVLSGTTFTFTPTADNANISVTELQNYLRNYSVEIKTARAAGTQVGSVVFDTPVSVDKNVSGSGGLTFTLNCGGDVLFNHSLSLRNPTYPENPGYYLVVNAGGNVRVGGVLDFSGYSYIGPNFSYPAGRISMVIGGDLLMSGSGQVLTMGTSRGYTFTSYPGSTGGEQRYVVNGGIDLASGSVLNASGGAFPSLGYNTLGGDGGVISLSAVNRIMLGGSILSRGGNGYRGGTGGSITVSSSGSNLDYSGTLISQGGDGYNASATAGRGGPISLTGTSGLSMRSDINTLNGSIGVNNSGGAGVILSTNNPVITTGGGVNDGQVSGVIRGYQLDKRGSGVLSLAGANAYTNFTHITAGSIVRNAPASIPVTSTVIFYDQNAVLDLHGYNLTLYGLGGSVGKVTNSSPDEVTLTIGHGGGNRFGGLIEDGNGRLHLTKSGVGTAFLENRVHTYSGTTNITGGILQIEFGTTLGSTVGETIVNGGQLQLWYSTVTGEPITLYSAPATGALTARRGNSRWNGTINLGNASSIYVGYNAASLTITPTSGPAIQGTNTNLTLYTIGNLTINGEIATGNATLTKNEAGILTLNGANSYHGLTTLNAGQTIIKNALGLGSNLEGTELGSTANLTLDGALNVIGETLTMSSNAITANGSLLTKNGASSWSGDMTLSGSSVNWNNESDLTVTGNISNAATQWTVGRTAATTGNLVINGIISGIAALEKTGSGMLTLNAANTYTGLTRLTGGTIQLGVNQAIPMESSFYFNGGTLSTAGFTETTGVVHILENSRLLFSPGVHRVTFSLPGTFMAGKLLNVYGWEEDFAIPPSGQRPNLVDSGMLQTSSSRFVTLNGVLRAAGGINQFGQINITEFPGTAGKLFINMRLTLPMLEQIKFVNDADSSVHFSMQLGSNEIVPDYTR
jgi:fibronectin-binding autotransporter adhesin